MDRPFDEELLSAYFDGELDAVERAAVEQWLARSPEARESLEHFRWLSMAVREIRVQPLSDQFPKRVLELIEREAVVGAATRSAGVCDADAASAGWSWRRRWRLGLVAACAAVLGAAVLWWPRGEPLLIGRHDAMPEAASDRAAGGGPESLAAPTVAGEQAAAPMLAASGNAEVAPPASDAGFAASAGVFDSEGMRFYVVRRDDDGRQLWLRRSPEELRIGDVVEAMAADEENVALVQLHVVDRVEGLRRLQLLLADNSIAAPVDAAMPAAPRAGVPERAVGDRSTPAAPRQAGDGAAESGLIGVYVETDGTNLRTALLRMLQEPEFREIAIGPQVRWAALGDDVQRQVAVLRSQVAAAQVPGSVALGAVGGERNAARPGATAKPAEAAPAGAASRSSAPRVAALHATPASPPEAADSGTEAKNSGTAPRKLARRAATAGAAPISPGRAARAVGSAKASVAEARKPQVVAATDAVPEARQSVPENGASRPRASADFAAKRAGSSELRTVRAGTVAGFAGGWMNYQVPIQLPESVLETTRRIMEQGGQTVSADTNAQMRPAGPAGASGDITAGNRPAVVGAVDAAAKPSAAADPGRAVVAGGEARTRSEKGGGMSSSRPASLRMPKRVLFLVVEEPAARSDRREPERAPPPAENRPEQ